MKIAFGNEVRFIKQTVIAALLIMGCGGYSNAAGQDGGTLSGEIRTVDGAPAGKVRVVAVFAENLAAAAEAQTDAVGRYRLQGIQSGEYLVVAVGSDVLTMAGVYEAVVTTPGPRRATFPLSVNDKDITNIQWDLQKP